MADSSVHASCICCCCFCVLYWFRALYRFRWKSKRQNWTRLAICSVSFAIWTISKCGWAPHSARCIHSCHTGCLETTVAFIDAQVASEDEPGSLVEAEQLLQQHSAIREEIEGYMEDYSKMRAMGDRVTQDQADPQYMLLRQVGAVLWELVIEFCSELKWTSSGHKPIPTVQVMC